MTTWSHLDHQKLQKQFQLGSHVKLGPQLAFVCVSKFAWQFKAQDVSAAGEQSGMLGERTKLIEKVFKTWDALPMVSLTQFWCQP